MHLTPDEAILWQHGWVKLNLTLAFTWLVMALLVAGSVYVTRQLARGGARSRWQHVAEILVLGVRGQMREIGLREPDRQLPFVGTLFLFVLLSNVLFIVPGFHPPTSSLSTTAALALCVFLAVPVFGVRALGWRAYLRRFLHPHFLLLPINIIAELSRTLALAVRLFGNMMSAAMVGALMLGVIPLVFPAFLDALGLLTGVVQAYIFAVLATVFVAAGVSGSET